MPKSQTEASKYPSRYSPGNYITEAQYITELICEKKAKSQKKELPNKFWNLPEWQKFYRQQILAATSLLRLYKAKAIIAALNNKEAWNIYSLRAPQLDAIIEGESRKLKEIESKEQTIELDTHAKPRPVVGNKKNIVNRLREIE